MKKNQNFRLRSSQAGFSAVEGLLVLVIVGFIAFVGWYVYQSKQSADKNYTSASNASTTTISSAKKTTAAKTKATTPPKVTISAALKENTSDAIESQNTAALEGYMASSVTVVIAASEKGGAETATEAIKDLDYLNSGTSPWDFNLSADTLTAYKNGDYAKYFGDNTIIGKSANNYVVSFGVNDSGKIDTVFMAASSDLLN